MRNSVSDNRYVANEIITTRAGMRIRVGNMDADGRMTMFSAGPRKLALSGPDLQPMTAATLAGRGQGHACLAVRDYIIMDNGLGRFAGTTIKVQEAGEKIVYMFKISTIRREDWDLVSDKSEEFVFLSAAV